MNGDIMDLVLIGLAAYAIGNINPAILIGKIYKVDIRKEGSGNAGMTNTIRVIGLWAGIVVLIVDVLKAFAAVKMGFAFGGTIGAMTAFGAVVIGHCFPAAWGFKGGKGVAASLGAALALDSTSALLALMIAAMLIIIFRRVSVGSIGAALVYPVLIYNFMPDCFYFSIGAGVFLLIMHAANISRIAKGEEKKLTVGKRKLGGDRTEEAAAEEDAADGTSEISVVDSPLTEEERRNITASEAVMDDIENGESPIAAEATKQPGLVEAQKQEAVRPEPEPIDHYAGIEIPDLGKDARKIAVIGNGSFGTAIANLLTYNGHHVTLYGRNKDAIELMKQTRMNDHYLPYAILSDRINYTNNIRTAVRGKDIVVYAVPTQQFRAVSEKTAKYLKEGVIAVNLAKGIEQKTLKRLSEIASETIPTATYVALSGPSHAEEIVRNLPASVVAASLNKAAAEQVQDVFMSENFRVYTQSDMTGVEIAGAVKNVIAIATGISDGMKLGSNARAALMTRAMHEISRLGMAMGADPMTLAGLSGIGDLIVTCSTNLSRNRRCGLLIGLGLEAEDAVSRVGSVVEGFYTAEAVCELAEQYDVEMPICRVTYNVLKGELAPEKAIHLLMSRDKKDELV